MKFFLYVEVHPMTYLIFFIFLSLKSLDEIYKRLIQIVLYNLFFILLLFNSFYKKKSSRFWYYCSLRYWWVVVENSFQVHYSNEMNFHCIIIWILLRINTKSSIKKSTYDKITITDQLKSVYSFRLIDKLKLELTFIFLLCFANSSKYSYFLNLLIFFIPILWCFHSSTIRIIECFLEEMNRLI